MADITSTSSADRLPSVEASGGMKSNAIKVALGILTTRVLGFVRTAMVARYFGVGAHADVWTIALRTPNVLQNLLGEQVLSAAFIPVYSRMIEEGREEEAGRYAGAIFGLLLAVAGGLAILGSVAAGPIVAVFVPGFYADVGSGVDVNRYELAVQAVRIVFPMTGILVLSAWSLGVLNSHRRFYLPYLAPALWNTTIIATLVAVGEPLLRSGELNALANKDRLLMAICWGALVGGGLQFAVQFPTVWRLLGGLRVRVTTKVRGVRKTLRSLGPVIAGRGVVQISSYLDGVLGSFLALGAVAAIDFAYRLYLLPVGLFAMSVVAAELPELSRMGEEETELRRSRISSGLRQMAFLTIPTAVGYLVFGGLIVGGVYQRGSFDVGDTWLVTLILGGYTLGLLPSTSSRLLVNSFYSLGDTKTPAKIAAIRIFVSVSFSLGLMIWLDGFLLTDWVAVGRSPLRLGALGLAIGSVFGALAEWFLLYWRLRSRLEELHLPWWAGVRMLFLAAASAFLVTSVHRRLSIGSLWLEALVVVSAFACVYLIGAWFLRFPEPRLWTSRLSRG